MALLAIANVPELLIVIVMMTVALALLMTR